MTLSVFLSPLVHATWYFKEHKICDPGQSNHLPFSGFKICRQYKISGLFPPFSMHFLSITHCDHGKVDYQKVIRTSSSTDIDWKTPFCMLKPKLGAMLPLKEDDTVQRLIQNQMNPNQTVHTTAYEDTYVGRFTRLVRNKFDKALRALTADKIIQYTGKTSYDHLQDIKQSDPQSSIEWEARNLVCYKLARRKKYAKRDITFYMPHTFVGGLYECPVSAEQRKKLFQQFGNEEFLRKFDFECDSSVARPISPLIASDSTQQWFETNFHDIFNPSLVQTIPYLSTASTLNFRFATSSTSDMNMDTWATKLDANENYAYTESDLHVISRAVALSADYLNKIISPIDINKLFQGNKLEMSRSQKLENSALEEADFESMMAHLSPDQRLQLIISSKAKKVAMYHLNKLQQFWENLD
ncbi:uncharacterized protein RJT20DRAFT_146257 [Scheffersomyces xylosifermentans]|uniref:uncharacterized protein n=1 Tax=Scheffersomyces xylosifermentans TaxID=1304137 RepID=UPI00315CA633